MKTMIALMLTAFYTNLLPAYAVEPHLGTWKLNEAKSKLNPKGTKIIQTVYAPLGEKVKVTIDGIGPDGAPIHDEWMGKLDGQDYPVAGSPRAEMRSYERLDEHTLQLLAKVAGNVVTHAYVVISADGRTRTTLAVADAPGGRKVPYIAVYDKQ